jgi:hypothetical protein
MESDAQRILEYEEYLRFIRENGLEYSVPGE